jgi:hypothetical protein
MTLLKSQLLLLLLLLKTSWSGTVASQALDSSQVLITPPLRSAAVLPGPLAMALAVKTQYVSTPPAQGMAKPIGSALSGGYWYTS